MSNEQLVVKHPGTGRATWAMDSLFEHLLEPGQSERLGVALVTQPSGVATPLHRHAHEAEAFYVLEGRLDYQAGDDIHELDAGAFIHLPRGLPHAFRIRGETPARFLALTAPAGLLQLYEDSCSSTTRSASRRQNGGSPARTGRRWRWRSRSGSRWDRATDSR